MTDFERGFIEELQKIAFIPLIAPIIPAAAAAAGLYGAHKLKKKVFGGDSQSQQQMPSPVININGAMPQQEMPYNPTISGMTY